MPIGTWSLTLTGGRIPGSYGGEDEMICTGLVGGPVSVTFQPANSPPIQQIAASSVDQQDSIHVAAGTIENSLDYLAEDLPNDPFRSATLVEGTVSNGMLHLVMSGEEQVSGEDQPRTIAFSATCPLFPAG